MIYLDYSATTFVSDEVLESFTNACKLKGNPNSNHRLGVECNKQIENSTKKIAELLKVLPEEIIYTSGSSESNNLAIKGICLKENNTKKHIITTNYEHSSVISPLHYLQDLGFEVDFVDTDKNGVIDIEKLKELIREDTILISIASVNSEIGIIEPVEEIGKYLKENHPNIYFHVDMTQTIGKLNIKLDNIDLVSISAHKIFGIKGIGLLIKKKNITLEPLIHGGKSTTIYRSGTPQTELIISIKTAIEVALKDIDKKYKYVETLNKEVINFLKKYKNIHINSNSKCIPHIINFSFITVNPKELQKKLSDKEVYISTQTACSTGNISPAVYSLTKDKKIAETSLRLSLSYITTKEELQEFYKIFDQIYKEIENENSNN